MILLIAVKAEAVFKITAPLAGSYRKGIEPAGPWACLVDAAQPSFRKIQESSGPVVFSMKMGKHSWVSGIGSQYRVNTSSIVQMLGSQPRK